MILNISVLMVAILTSEIQLSTLIVVSPSSLPRHSQEPPGAELWGPGPPWEGAPPRFVDHVAFPNETAQMGDDVRLHCGVEDLGDKTVSWVKRHGQSFELLTFGHLTYSSEDRYSLMFVDPNDWTLLIKSVQSKDSGLYECQVSSHPPLARCTYLFVLVPLVTIVDTSGVSVAERFYRLGSTIELTCVGTAPPYHKDGSSAPRSRMMWMFGDKALNHDITRGGISVKTEATESGLTSQLHVAGARRADSGSYHCVLSDVRATVVVHVLAGEYADAMQYGAASGLYSANYLQISIILQILCLRVLFPGVLLSFPIDR